MQLAPQRPGHSSVGVRINLKDHFKGAILEARFTRRALTTGRIPEDAARVSPRFAVGLTS